MYDGSRKPCGWKIPIPTAFSKNLIRMFYALLIWALMTALPVFAAEEDYLKALESEADNTSSLNQKQSNNPTAAKSGGVKNSVKEDFEKLLEFELPSTYKFYTKLKTDDQIKVVKLYSREKKMSAASKLIFDLYFENNK
ncbi:MAG: hypothetical protein AMJ53_05065 [Gammaproteobacteria bacterium SG8_11]|nr:MAG: hypothetical protein AMJ53_05065 [Gammaproteobacteria bacterium SG8_11]